MSKNTTSLDNPKGSAQLVLDLPHRPSLRGEDFFVSESNADAVAAIDRWPDWQQGTLALIGPAASGKSHLASVWQQRSDAAPLTVGDLSESTLATLDPGAAYLLEDLDRSCDETALFHLLNWVREGRGSLLLTSSRPLSRLEFSLPDLRSRLAAITVAEMLPPDDALLSVLLAKQFADRQIALDSAVASYVIARIERSAAMVSRVVEAMDKAALSENRGITVPLARQVLRTLAD